MVGGDRFMESSWTVGRLMEDGLWGYGTPVRLWGGSATHKLLAAIAGEIRTYEH